MKMNGFGVVILASSLFLSACGGGKGGPPTAPTPVASLNIGQAGGTLASLDASVNKGATLTAPTGAVSTSTIITIAPFSGVLPAQGVPGAAYEFTPHGQTFLKPVTIVLKYDPAKLPAGSAEADLCVAEFIDGTFQITAGMGSCVVDTQAKTVTTTTTHFSIFSIVSRGNPLIARSVILSDNLSDALHPQIAVSGSTVLVTWDDDAPVLRDIFVARSTNGGATFSAPVNISNNAGGSFDPQIAISGATVLVTWYNTPPPPPPPPPVDPTAPPPPPPPPADLNIFVARSTDGGATFSAPVNISNNVGLSIRPQIVISGATVLVTWDNAPHPPPPPPADPDAPPPPRIPPPPHDIFVARSADGGATFSTPVNISNNAGDSIVPQIAIFGATALVTWLDDTPRNHDVFVARSADGGATFSAPINISNNVGTSFFPQISISGATVLITWFDDTPENTDIFVARSTDGGGTFSSPVNLSNNAGASFQAQISISGATALVTWSDTTPGNGNIDIFVARSTDGGATFSTPVNLSNNARNARNPQIVISGATALVTWSKDTSGRGTFDIFVARSADGGATFSAPANISNSGRSSRTPQIVISGATALITWQDKTSENHVIFFARSE